MANQTELLKARLVAARLSPQQVLVLRNTVTILRLSGAQLTDEQKERLEAFDRVVQAYREIHGGAR